MQKTESVAAEREIKNLWACLLSLKDSGTIDEAQMLKLAEKFGL